MRTSVPFIVLSLAACSAPSAPAPVVVEAAVATSSASAPDARPPVRPRPRSGKAGWFAIPKPYSVSAVVLDDGRCVAVGFRDRWLVTPFKTPHGPHPSRCDGDAQPVADMPDAFRPIRQLGGGVLYGGFMDDIATSETPDGPLTVVKTPFGGGNMPTAAGTTVLLIGKKDKKLHSLDGATWKSVPLDGADVLSVVGTRDGEAFAVTSKNHLYVSSDGAKTWKETPTTGFAKLTEVAVGTPINEWHSTRGQLGVWGTASVAGADYKVGDRVSATLKYSVPVDLFYSVELQFPLPDGVTDPDGVDLIKQRGAAQSLASGRACDAFDMLGDVAVASCHEDKSRYFVFTDDAGASVTEIGRAALSGGVRLLEVSEGQVLVVPGCFAGDGDCGDTAPYVLERGDGEGAWPKKVLDVPKGVRVEMAIDGRQGRGFYLVGSRRVPSADKTTTETVLEVFRTGEERVARKALTGTEAPPIFGTTIQSVRAMDVNDDGSLALVVGLDRGMLGFLHLSARLEPTVVQPCESPLLPLAAAVALRGPQIAAALPDGRFVISTDGCNTMTSYDAVSDADRDTNVRCGPEGCNFASMFGGEERLWRWGERPADEFMGTKRR